MNLKGKYIATEITTTSQNNMTGENNNIPFCIRCFVGDVLHKDTFLKISVQILNVYKSWLLHYYTFPYSIEQFTRSGDDFLEEMSYLDYNVWFNHLGLVLHGIFYLILAYIFLKTLKKR